MKTQVADTSLDAYHAHRDSGRLSDQQQAVLDWLRAHPGDWTRSEIAQRVGIRLSSACGRLNELVASGHVQQLTTRRAGSSLVRLAVGQLVLFS